MLVTIIGFQAKFLCFINSSFFSFPSFHSLFSLFYSLRKCYPPFGSERGGRAQCASPRYGPVWYKRQLSKVISSYAMWPYWTSVLLQYRIYDSCVIFHYLRVRLGLHNLWAERWGKEAESRVCMTARFLHRLWSCNSRTSGDDMLAARCPMLNSYLIDRYFAVHLTTIIETSSCRPIKLMEGTASG